MGKRIIGLTGGIATGKTTVANYLASAYNLPILDADVYAREAVIVDSPIYRAIAQRYGTQILLADGSLHRQNLGEIIFHQPEERRWLESLIHPYVGNCFRKSIAESYAQVLVLVIPLLFEAGMTDLVTEIWVVYCSASQQQQRLMQRNNLSAEQATLRINTQLPLTEKMARADVILDNSSTLQALLEQVDKAVNR